MEDLSKNSTNTQISTMPAKLKQVRLSKNMSMQAFGERIGVSPSAISLFEAGKNNPKVDTLNRIAQEFDIDLNWLLGKAPFDAHAIGFLADFPGVELPLVSFKLRASFVELGGADTTHFETLLLRLGPNDPPPAYYTGAIVFEVDGDSMEPTMQSGQKVIAWPVPEGKWEQLHNVPAVVAYDDTVTVKAIKENDLFTLNRLTLRATGQDGGYFVVPRSSINSIWEVREFFDRPPLRLKF